MSDIVIIGGGVTGCSIAYHLTKLGMTSQIVERDSIACQASGKAWGVVSPPVNLILSFEGNLVSKGSMRSCLPLSAEGIRRFPSLARELKEVGGVDIGYGELPVLCAVFDENEESYLKGRVLELKKEGFELDWIAADEVRARFPDVASGVRGGILWPGHQVEPYRYALGLAQAAEAKGATIRQGEAKGFHTRGSRVTSVVTNSKEAKGDIFVLAAGPWTGKLAAELGRKIPTRVIRDQCLVVELPHRFAPYRVSSSQGCGVAIVPKVDGKVILGRLELDVVDFDDRPTEEFRLSVMEAGVKTVPVLEEARLIEHRAALGTWHPTGGEPMLGRLPGWDNVYVALWLGAFGIQWSPAVGRIMADLIVNGRSAEAEPFNPAQYLN